MKNRRKLYNVRNKKKSVPLTANQVNDANLPKKQTRQREKIMMNKKPQEEAREGSFDKRHTNEQVAPKALFQLPRQFL
jgi:hypothetical protein